MAIIKKADVLHGILDPKKVQIESLGGELWLRPLSSAEVDEINQIEAEGYGNYETNSKNQTRGNKTSIGETISKGKINVLKMQKATTKAKYTAIYMSLDNSKNEDDPWEMGDIQALKQDQVDELHKKVQEISGMNVSEEDIETFPQDE